MATGVEHDYPDWVKELAEEEWKLQWMNDTNIYHKWCSEGFVHRSFRWNASRQWLTAWYEAKKWNYDLLRDWVSEYIVKEYKDSLLDECLIENTTTDEATEYFENKKPKISRLTFL